MGGNTSRLLEVHVDGTVAPGYESVRTMFEENFKTGRETHAQLCVYVAGEQVVDLWGSIQADSKYNGDTLTNVFSSTKSLTAIAMAMMVDKGLINYDNKITDYWPEFGKNNKQDTTVADLMRHEAGLAGFTHVFQMKDFLPENLKKNDVGLVVEHQEMWYKEGKPREYHALTRGWIANEVFRRVEPQGRTIGEVLRAVVNEPLGARAYIGLKKDEIDQSFNVEAMKMSFILGQSLKTKSSRKIDVDFVGILKMANMLRKMKGDGRPDLPHPIEGLTDNLAQSMADCANDPIIKQGEGPSYNGQCCARGLALIGAAMANKGNLNGVEIIGEKGWESLHANPIIRPTFSIATTNFTQGGVDLIQPQDAVQSNPNHKAIRGPEGFYGWMGFGGSVFQWHPGYKIGFAYVPVLLTVYDMENLKAKKLQEEVMNCYQNIDPRTYRLYANNKKLSI